MRELRFVLTPFCNYKCFFCHGENISNNIALQLRPKDYEFMAKTTLDHFGWNTCTITGGEPLISPIFNETCRLLKELGLSTTVVTNASLLARPKETLKDVAQVNISLHTMNPSTYPKITQIGYPLESTLSTIVSTRAALPELKIHLNYTVIKGLNDSTEEFEQFLLFAKEVHGLPKFINLSSPDPLLATSAEDIVAQLERLDFTLDDSNSWQYFLSRGNESTTVTKCPFNGKYEDLPVRDIFVDPNGTLYRSYGGHFSVNALNEIKSQNETDLLEKINVFLS